MQHYSSKFFMWHPIIAPDTSTDLIIIDRGNRAVRGDTLLVCKRQAIKQLITSRFNVGKTTIDNMFKRLHTGRASPFLVVTPLEARILKVHHAIDRGAANTTLVPWPLLHKVLVRLEAISPELEASFQRIHEWGVGDLVRLGECQEEEDEDECQQTVVPSLPTPAPRLQLPTTLPAVDPSVLGRTKQRYGLKSVAPHLLHEFPLKGQLQALRDWLTGGVRMNRPARLQLASSNSHTWASVEKDVTLFLGYAFTNHEQAPVELQAYRDAFTTAFVPFLSFLDARKIEGGTMQGACLTGKYHWQIIMQHS